MQINNNFSPNFGILKVKSSAARELWAAAEEPEVAAYLRSLYDAKIALKDAKKCNLVIERDLSATIETPKNKYTGIFDVLKPSDSFPEFVNVRTLYGGKPTKSLKRGSDFVATFVAPSPQAATELYEKCARLPYYDRVAEIAKFIDSVM